MFGSVLTYLSRKGRRFRADERGATAIFMAAGVAAFVGIAGLGVDAARGYLVQSRLSSALDAAGLAGARIMFSPSRDAEIQKYFNANFPNGYLGATVTPPSPAPVTPGQTALTLTASATIETTLTKVLGFDTLTVAAATEVTRATPSLDVVIAMDMSGSMNQNTAGNYGAPLSDHRITLAKTAAKQMTSILFNDPNVPSLNFGLVPWSSKVNVSQNGVTFDPTATTTTTVPNFANPNIASGPFQSQDKVYYANNSEVPLLCEPGAAEAFDDENGNGVRNWGEPYGDCHDNGSYDGAYTWQGCVYARHRDDGVANDADLEVGPVYGIGGKDWPAWEPDRTDDYCLDQGITPLQDTQAEIDAAIDNLSNPNGSTEMIAGLAWAWRVLVPQAPFTEAPPDPNSQRIKAIVFLTDGEYTTYTNDSYKGDLSSSAAQNRLRALATKIKETGIRIYTIQFATTSGVQLMKDVATGPFSPFYSNAASGDELNLVFQQIADDLVELHISK